MASDSSLQNNSANQGVRITSLVRPENENDFLDLFQAAFRHQMPPELLRWKYCGLVSPGMLVKQDGLPVAFYGGMPRAINLLGTPVMAVQIGDVMVHPRQRGILSRKGLFFQVASSFLEHFVGDGKTFPVAFGFPSERAFRLAAHLGLYERVGELMQVSWPALKARPSYKFLIRPINPDQDVAAVDRLWLEMADALQDQIIGVRDWSYVQQRYLQHPAFTYQIYLVSSRWTGVPVGIFVIRVHEDTVELLDMIAPPQRLSILVHCLRRVAWGLGKPRVHAWITNQNARLLAGGAGEIASTGITIPHNKWTSGIPASKILDRWWLMGGDTDFN
ncbi:hypothetical protein GALL_362100 [mine drainage metagenome]|uniref:Uncharacterized protein n=1 Tax=mine drainage metagenome TaxID=410659 RepID=A0A1J5QEY2_9ZZZZ